MAGQFQIGETVADYKILMMLGSGGTGRVFQVEHVVTKRIEAMKILLDHVAGDDRFGERFLREVRVQASLSHPNIAAAYNAFYAAGALVMVMEWAPGKSLRTLSQERAIPLNDALICMCQVLDALEYAHAQGVVHRDVTPANIIVSGSGQVKLTDFGLAKPLLEPRLTQAGMAMGSLHYMAPEQIRGLPGVDHRADIYAAGVVLYELLTGRKPFEAEDSFSLMRAHVEEVPAAPATLAKGIPLELDAAVLCALSKRPEDRFATAAAFRDALVRLIGEPRPGVAALFHRAVVRRPRLKRLSIAGAAAALAVLLALQIQRLWPLLAPPKLAIHVRHAPPIPEAALKPPYLPSEALMLETKSKHPVRRFLGRLNPFGPRRHRDAKAATEPRQ
jgi:eukaryotic-like serine/threonine-protein kinase